nr:MAG TPA: hypothetical protein [Caudoviricetes sp.]
MSESDTVRVVWLLISTSNHIPKADRCGLNSVMRIRKKPEIRPPVKMAAAKFCKI